MRATIISMVMKLPGSLPGMSVAGGLRSARKRGAVSRARGEVCVRSKPRAAYRRFLQRPWG